MLESWELSFHTKVSEINEPIQKFLDDKFSGLYPADLMILPDPESSKVAVTALFLKLRKDSRW